jgi:hypothetical protein
LCYGEGETGINWWNVNWNKVQEVRFVTKTCAVKDEKTKKNYVKTEEKHQARDSRVSSVDIVTWVWAARSTVRFPAGTRRP